jgi:hypothetical protein
MMFIGVAIALFLGMYYLNVTLTTMRAKASDETTMHVVSELARNHLRHCYGDHLEYLDGNCPIQGINGYEIHMMDYGDCTNQLMKYEGARDSKTVSVSYVPVFHSPTNLTCLGKIVIYI